MSFNLQLHPESILKVEGHREKRCCEWMKRQTCQRNVQNKYKQWWCDPKSILGEGDGG